MTVSSDSSQQLAAPPVRAASGVRLVYVDWLRVLAVLGVFVIHVGEVFNPWDEWHITNASRSQLVGEVVVLMAPWIMPLFMLLAGVSAWFSLQRRGNTTYLRERVARVLLPLVVGTLLLVPPQVYLERRLRGQFTGSFWRFLPHFFDGIYPRGNLSWHHLWFLAHLFLYSVIALPLFRYWQREQGRAQLRRIARFCAGPGGIFWLALPLVLERHALWSLFPERHMLTSDWSNHALLLVAYIYGFILAGEPRLGADIDRQWGRALLVACASTALLVAGTLADLVPDRLPPPYTPGYLLFWTLYAVGAWAWMVAVLGLGRLLLTRETRVLRYGREIGYGWYLMHQPVIVAVAFVVVQWRVGIPVKLTALVIASAAGTLVGAELLRSIPPLRRVFGLGVVTRATPAPAHPAVLPARRLLTALPQMRRTHMWRPASTASRVRTIRRRYTSRPTDGDERDR